MNVYSVYVHVYMCMFCVRIYACMYVFICAYVSMCIYLYANLFVHLCICLYIYVKGACLGSAQFSVAEWSPAGMLSAAPSTWSLCLYG